MHVMILGGGGFLGQRLARALAARGRLRGQAVTAMTLADLTPPPAPPAPFPVASRALDIADRAALDAGLGADVDVLFLLAAVVSSHAETDFDAGLRANFFGPLHVLERLRALKAAPVVVFASSLAVYGGETPDPITDASFLNPQTSYGAQKAVGELLINDYSRRGFIDGRALRLPTISVRPGRPNRAASSFMSSIFREPLLGEPATCPVGRDFAHYYLSPGRCIENLIRGAELDAAELGQNRAMIMPGKMWTIGAMIDAMTAVAGPEPASRIRFEPDPAVAAIVGGWRADLRADKALALGMRADDSFEDNIRAFLAESAAL